MAYIQETLETIQCDNCKNTYQDENSGYGFWLDKNDAWEAATDDGWAEENENHYCPKCHHYNHEDQLLINSERTKVELP